MRNLCLEKKIISIIVVIHIIVIVMLILGVAYLVVQGVSTNLVTQILVLFFSSRFALVF